MFKFLTKAIDVPCKGYRLDCGCDGYDYDCEYEASCEFFCDECVCNFGYMNPVNGKEISNLMKFVQNKRAIEYYKNKEKK